MNQEDHNKTEKNLITLLNWYRLKRVNEFAAQCDEAQAWESIGYECTPIGAALPLPAC